MVERAWLVTGIVHLETPTRFCYFLVSTGSGRHLQDKMERVITLVSVPSISVFLTQNLVLFWSWSYDRDLLSVLVLFYEKPDLKSKRRFRTSVILDWSRRQRPTHSSSVIFHSTFCTSWRLNPHSSSRWVLWARLHTGFIWSVRVQSVQTPPPYTHTSKKSNLWPDGDIPPKQPSVFVLVYLHTCFVIRIVPALDHISHHVNKVHVCHK